MLAALLEELTPAAEVAGGGFVVAGECGDVRERVVGAVGAASQLPQPPARLERARPRFVEATQHGEEM